MTAAARFQTKNEWLHEIGTEAELNGSALLMYIEFMQRRFPDEIFKSYALEWARRWATGQPEVYADNESLVAIAAAKLGVMP